MACRTLSTSTEYSMVAVTPSTSWLVMGTTLPMLREINKSPGSVPRIRSGTTRESAQVMNSHAGVWPSDSR